MAQANKVMDYPPEYVSMLKWSTLITQILQFLHFSHISIFLHLPDASDYSMLIQKFEKNCKTLPSLNKTIS